ncbi:MAG TPA: hypothetical protein DDX68_09490, partial [Clostridium sp.]|nr:hypothetical protein [Clostridium sp.]
AVSLSPPNVIVYASWNGSTETAAWRVLSGPAPDLLDVDICSTLRTGFETKIIVPSFGPYFQVKALDANGKKIGKSKIVCLDFELKS